MVTEDREYKLPRGVSLDEDLPRIQEGFRQVDKDVTLLYKKVEDGLTKLKEETASSEGRIIAMFGNLSLKILETSQKIRIGVQI